MTDLDKANPEFTIAIRGYDRLQVDEYLYRLQQLLAAAEERVRMAEKHTEHSAVGPRVAQIFELANAEADDIRDEAEREVKARVTQARQKAEKIVRGAKRAAAEAAEQARRDHDELIATLSDERDAVRAEVVLLEKQRGELLADLRKLHGALGDVARVAGLAPDALVASAGADATAELTRPLRAVGE